MSIKLILLVFFANVGLLGRAQVFSYEQTDSISIEISKLQTETNGFKYFDGSEYYELFFPEESFKIYSHNLLATSAVYKKKGDQELLFLAEDIDFSKAIGFMNAFSDLKINRLLVYFPPGYLKIQVFENGVFIRTISSDYLEFYRTNVQLIKGLTHYLYELCTGLQLSKGLTTKSLLKTQEEDLKKLSSEDFLKKHPYTLYTMHLKDKIKQKEEKAQQEYLKVKSYIDGLCAAYLFKPGLSPDEFKAYNPAAAKIMKKKNQFGTVLAGDSYGANAKNACFIFFDKYGKLNTYQFDIIYHFYDAKFQEIAEINAAYQQMVQQIEASIPAEFIRKEKRQNGADAITVFHPKLNVEVSYSCFYNPRYIQPNNYSISFKVVR